MTFDEETIRRVHADTEAALQRSAQMGVDHDARGWLVSVPPYDAEGVVIERFVITEEMANLDKLRAALNPQRGDRSIDPGTFTKLTVDGALWMTDTPAEIRDLRTVDEAMSESWSVLIVGLGLGVVLHRAITAHHVGRIDVVEVDKRIIHAVGPHYYWLAKKHDVDLAIHRADIHDWQPERGPRWDVGWFDIWRDINDLDMPEVKRLRDRFRRRLGWSGAWAQNERVAMRRRINSGKWAY